ncbi:peroxiredoxin [Stieleria sp. JC731]|uniref:peroxiredoxin n=1 Tax=Pirellulaceae TaxID=2691357 RepID=UPI001E2943EB|nr:peroxiredoxin [Stieleria sp. JC731]MCC9599611.1 peroxiredoxin [Stieleria sp. JC731]
MKLILTTLLLTFTCSLTASAVDIGDKAPKFKAKADSGEMWKSEDHVGKKILVVYFYPADMTGGCTKQACGYRDKMKDFTDAGVEVIGVSGDTVENHKIFKDVHDLNFTLLADTEGKVAEAFGVPVTLGDKAVTKLIGNIEKELVRKATAKRWTFVIDLDGNIAYKDSEVKAAQDPEKITAVIAKLK